MEIQPNVDGTPDIFSPTSLVAPMLRLLDDRLVKGYSGAWVVNGPVAVIRVELSIDA